LTYTPKIHCEFYIDGKGKRHDTSYIEQDTIRSKSLLNCDSIINITPREIFKKAIISSVNSIILAHNHPSGDCTPSADDMRVTRKLIEAGRIIDIQVLDHVIIGKSFYSMKENCIVQFE
jgi:hypothetical protein